MKPLMAVESSKSGEAKKHREQRKRLTSKTNIVVIFSFRFLNLIYHLKCFEIFLPMRKTFSEESDF